MVDNKIYISFDVEASGPIPGDYSMLSFGACVVGNEDVHFYRELRPINNNFAERALEITKFDMEVQKEKGADPQVALMEFAQWANRVSEGKKIVLLSYGTFDYMYLKWYLEHYKIENNFGVNWMDMKSYIHGYARAAFGEYGKNEMKKDARVLDKHTHNALGDAIEQSRMFNSLIKLDELLGKDARFGNLIRKDDSKQKTKIS
ncbi:MAG: exonuclease [Candidatus Micrarchaeota archaeon]|nr:exonuclease [Candidatus Micrarchaeota archaeon]